MVAVAGGRAADSSGPTRSFTVRVATEGVAKLPPVGLDRLSPSESVFAVVFVATVGMANVSKRLPLAKCRVPFEGNDILGSLTLL